MDEIISVCCDIGIVIFGVYKIYIIYRKWFCVVFEFFFYFLKWELGGYFFINYEVLRIIF